MNLTVFHVDDPIAAGAHLITVGNDDKGLALVLIELAKHVEHRQAMRAGPVHQRARL